jgi:PDZ domain-containing secreted protein
MLKTSKLIAVLLLISLSVVIVPTYAQQEPCDKCKENPENCKLIQTGICDDCNNEEKAVEKKIIIRTQDVDRGFLGVVTKETDKGLTILEVVPESPADKAGLKKDDIILTVKDKSAKTPDELINALKGTKPKDVVTLKIKTEGKEKTFDIALAKVPKTEMQKIKIKVMGDDDEDIDIEMPMMEKEITCPKCGTKIPMSSCCPMMGKDKCKMMLMGKEPMMKMEKMQVMGKCPECGMKDMEMEVCPYCNKKMEPCMPGMPEMPMMKKMEKEFMVMLSKPTNGFLGVVTEEKDGQLVIKDIVENSPAEKAGLDEDDIILSVNGTNVTVPQELIDVLKLTKPGDVASFKILSGGIEKTLDITLAPRPEPKVSPMPSKMRIRIGRHKAGRGAGYFGPGFTFFKYDDLNTLFSQHNLGSIEKQQFIFSGGGWGQVNRIRLGGFGMGGAKTVSNESLDVEVGYGAGFFELGYSIVNEKNFMITPLVGIGGYGLSMKITPKYNRPTTIDGLLSSPWSIARASKGGLAMYPGLAIDIPFSFVGLTFKGGYMWSPMSSAWTVENLGSIGNEPDPKLNGLFATAGIMFGGGR